MVPWFSRTFDMSSVYKIDFLSSAAFAGAALLVFAWTAAVMSRMERSLRECYSSHKREVIDEADWLTVKFSFSRISRNFQFFLLSNRERIERNKFWKFQNVVESLCERARQLQRKSSHREITRYVSSQIIRHQDDRIAFIRSNISHPSTNRYIILQFILHTQTNWLWYEDCLSWYICWLLERTKPSQQSRLSSEEM